MRKLAAREGTNRTRFIRFRVTAEQFATIAEAARRDKSTLLALLAERGWSHAVAEHAMNPDGWARAVVLREATARIQRHAEGQPT